LADPNLNVAEVAAEHHIPVRQLYKVLAEAGITPTDWLRTRRLEECRAELRNPLPGGTIESIAHRRGRRAGRGHRTGGRPTLTGR
jgi:AraC-like DNA-binding protein